MTDATLKVVLALSAVVGFFFLSGLTFAFWKTRHKTVSTATTRCIQFYLIDTLITKSRQRFLSRLLQGAIAGSFGFQRIDHPSTCSGVEGV
jgi:hypothetical protein